MRYCVPLTYGNTHTQDLFAACSRRLNFTTAPVIIKILILTKLKTKLHEIIIHYKCLGVTLGYPNNTLHKYAKNRSRYSPSL